MAIAIEKSHIMSRLRTIHAEPYDWQIGSKGKRDD